MPRKKKNITNFKLNPEWMFKEPIDFEYNKYTLLDYLQKCEKNFENLRIYPDFIELSLHLANLQSLIKESTLLLTEKKFEDIDDEILLKELNPKKPPKVKDDEIEELNKTLKYSASKMFDTFNLGKSVWNIAFDNVNISLKKNKQELESGYGYVLYNNKEEGKIMLWEYSLKRMSTDGTQNKTYFNLIFDGEMGDYTLTKLIEDFTSWKVDDEFRKYPIFEVKCRQKFPMRETFIPMMRRKLMTYIFQTINLKKILDFDETK